MHHDNQAAMHSRAAYSATSVESTRDMRGNMIAINDPAGPDDSKRESEQAAARPSTINHGHQGSHLNVSVILSWHHYCTVTPAAGRPVDHAAFPGHYYYTYRVAAFED